MSDVFISYARADRPRAEALVDVLRVQGWSVWWDREIIAGDLYDDVIDGALQEARCVIVLWSDNSVGSRWVRAEAAEGFESGKLVPIELDGARIPLEFRRVQTISLRAGLDDRDGLAQLVTAVRRLVGAGSGAGADGDGFVRVECASCGATNKAPAALAGRSGKCRQCGASVTVPGTPPGGDKASSARSRPPGRFAAERARGRSAAPSRALVPGVVAAGILAALVAAAAWSGAFDREASAGVAGAQTTRPASDAEHEGGGSAAHDVQSRGAPLDGVAAARETQRAEAERLAAESAFAQAAGEAERALSACDLDGAEAALARARGLRPEAPGLRALAGRVSSAREAHDEGLALLARLDGESHLRRVREARAAFDAWAAQRPDAAGCLGASEILARSGAAAERRRAQLASVRDDARRRTYEASDAGDVQGLVAVLVDVDPCFDELDPRLEWAGMADTLDPTLREALEGLVAAEPSIGVVLLGLESLDAARPALVARETSALAGRLAQAFVERAETLAHAAAGDASRAAAFAAVAHLLASDAVASDELARTRLGALADELLAVVAPQLDEADAAEARLSALEALFPEPLPGPCGAGLDAARARYRAQVDERDAATRTLARRAQDAVDAGELGLADALWHQLREGQPRDSRWFAISRLVQVECARRELSSRLGLSDIPDIETVLVNLGNVARLGDFEDARGVSIPALCAFREVELRALVQAIWNRQPHGVDQLKNAQFYNEALKAKQNAFKDLERGFPDATDRDGRRFVDKAREL